VWGWLRRELDDRAVLLRDVFGTDTAISGMALGFDMEWWDAAEACDGVNANACVPFPQQADRWLVAQKQRWRRAIEDAGGWDSPRVYVVGDLADIPPKRRSAEANRLLKARNDVMLTHCDVVVACYDQTRTHPSGTQDMWLKATGRRPLDGNGPLVLRPVIHLDPVSRRVRLVESHLPPEQQVFPDYHRHRAAA
jgi:hypothetical protein